MHRTQLSLEEWQHQALKSLADQQGRSISDLVRNILSRYLQRTRNRAAHNLRSIEGLAADPETSGESHDEYLYGNRPDS